MKRNFEAAFDDLAQLGALLRLNKCDGELGDNLKKLVNVFIDVRIKLTQNSLGTNIYELLLKPKKCALKLNLVPFKRLSNNYCASKDLVNDVNILQEQL